MIRGKEKGKATRTKVISFCNGLRPAALDIVILKELLRRMMLKRIFVYLDCRRWTTAIGKCVVKVNLLTSNFCRG